MFVHLKQSGESLTSQSSRPHTPDALQVVTGQIGEIYDNAASLRVKGLLVVTGGGNLARGAELRAEHGSGSKVAQYGDVLGRLATITNTVMLSAALSDVGIRNRVFAAPNMGFTDPELGALESYHPEAVKSAYREGRVALLAGGSGKSGQTTDAAVLDYALAHTVAFPDDTVVVLKATKYNGIYEADPRLDPTARQYAEVSARWMLEHEVGGLDRTCLGLIAQSQGDLQLQVFSAEKYTVAEALRQEVGTFVMSHDAQPVFESQSVA